MKKIQKENITLLVYDECTDYHIVNILVKVLNLLNDELDATKNIIVKLLDNKTAEIRFRKKNHGILL